MKGSEKEGIWDKRVEEEEKCQLAVRLHGGTFELLQPFFLGRLKGWDRGEAPVSSGLAAAGRWATPHSWRELREFGGKSTACSDPRVTDGGNLFQGSSS